MENNNEKKFYPDYLFEIIIVIFIAIELTIVLAMLYPQEIGRQIDYSAPFQPRPEWYFLWLFQLLKYFPGKTAFIGTVVIPLISIIALITIPYIDRGRYGRGKAIIVMSILFLMFIIFTLIPVLSPYWTFNWRWNVSTLTWYMLVFADLVIDVFPVISLKMWKTFLFWIRASILLVNNPDNTATIFYNNYDLY